MKKQLLLLLMAVVGLYMVACQSQDGATPSSDGDLEAIQVSAARTAADSTTKTKCKGKLTPIDSTALPSKVISYINTNYAGAQVKFAATDSLGQYVVGISLNSTHTGLLFDASGNFIQIIEKYGKKAKLTAVDITTLPASVASYVTTNYAGYTIKKAGTNADGNLFVGIANDTTRVVLVFDSTGTFVKVADIPPMNGGRGKGKGRGH
ncbi:PepSY-like domain-containing protein [Flectobacillus longus]|uniref:PepSY-like domain-containing protein n=1 Tax=Flectobacillus longus TaxID=2984207 RepID=UPI0024B7C801|nr:PepSY-like domain-containing protein [Flectobacillus longus]MDI9878143.1 PepSY-like domain-containing protein [Flectobacillus longus]